MSIARTDLPQQVSVVQDGARGRRVIPQEQGTVSDPLKRSYTGGEGAIHSAQSEVKILSSLGQKADKWADDEALRAGTNAGMTAGMKPDFQPLRGTGLYSDAFNKAGLESYATHVETVAAENAERIYKQHPGDPAALREALDAWGSSYEGGLFEQAQPMFRKVWSRRSLAYTAAADEAYEKNLIDTTIASNETALQAQTNSVAALAHSVANEGVFAKTFAEERDLFLAKLIAHAPREGGEFEGQQVQADPTRIPAYTWQQIQKKMSDFDQGTAIERTMGRFTRAPDKDGFRKMWIEEARKSGSAVYTPEIIDGLDRKMQVEINRIEAQQNKLTSHAVSLAGKIGENTKDGFDSPPELMAAMNQAVSASGSPEAQQAAEMQLALQDNMRLYRGMNPAALETLVNAELVPAAMKEGRTPYEAANLDLASGLLSSMKTQLANDPLSWGVRSGKVEAMPLFQMDQNTGKVAIDAAAVSARNGASDTMRRDYGVPAVIGDDEASQFAQIIGNSQPDNAMMFMRSMTEPLSAENRSVFARQIAPKAPEVAAAISMLQEDPEVSRMIIAGGKLDYKVGGDLAQTIDAELGTTVQDMQARDQIKAAVKNVYTYLAWKGKEGDVVNSSTVRKAVEMVVGPKLEVNSTSETLSYRFDGKWVGESQFNDVLEDTAKLGPDFVKATLGTVPVGFEGKPVSLKDIVEDGEWVAAGSGQYMVRVANARGIPGYFVQDAGGRPFMFDMPRLQRGLAQRNISGPPMPELKPAGAPVGVDDPAAAFPMEE